MGKKQPKLNRTLGRFGSKPTNPKDFEGMKKIPYHLFPMTAVAVGVLQMLDGGTKYGRENYREKGVKSSVYFDAAMRHLLDWFHGENRTKDTALRHLGGALASIAIIIDADINKKLIDDRAYTNRFHGLRDELEKEVLRILTMNKDKKPEKHYSALLLKKKKNGRK